MSYMYECPKCHVAAEPHEFLMVDNGKYAQCVHCQVQSLAFSFVRQVPAYKDPKFVDLAPAGYQNLAAVQKLSLTHKRLEELKSRSFDVLMRFYHETEYPDALDETREEVWDYLERVREAQHDFMEAVCGR